MEGAVVVDLGKSVHCQVTDIDEELIKIMKLIGLECEKYYI